MTQYMTYMYSQLDVWHLLVERIVENLLYHHKSVTPTYHQTLKMRKEKIY